MNRKPLISIITPLLNCEEYIGDTLESVVLQEYNNIEHIIIDGISDDRSLDIVKRYSQMYDHITWISEKDDGMYSAINKGLKMAKGEVIAYLNSDDLYKAGALKKVIDYFFRYDHIDVIYSKCEFMYPYANVKYKYFPFNRFFFVTREHLGFRSLQHFGEEK